MSKHHRYYVVPSPGGGWVVRQADRKKGGVFQKKSDAIEEARKVARRAGWEVVIHNKDGRIVQADTYPKGYGSQKNKFEIREGLDLTKPLFEQTTKRESSKR